MCGRVAERRDRCRACRVADWRVVGIRTEHATRLADNPFVQKRPITKKSQIFVFGRTLQFRLPRSRLEIRGDGAFAPYLIRRLENDSPTTVCFSARRGIDGFSRAFPGVFAARLTVCSYDARKKSREGESSRNSAPIGASHRRSFSRFDRAALAFKRRFQRRAGFSTGRARGEPASFDAPSRPLAVGLPARVKTQHRRWRVNLDASPLARAPVRVRRGARRVARVAVGGNLPPGRVHARCRAGAR